jgi:hypothetical protein
MGLLDGVLPNLLSDDPQKREAQKMGLLNFGAQMLANSQRGFSPALGYGLQGGANAYSSAQQEQQRSIMQKLQLEEAQRKAAMAKGMQEAATASILTPEQTTLLNGQGPTVANAAQIGTAKPQFDTSGFIQRMMAVDPLTGIQLQSSLAKETPFGKVDPKDYTPESVAKFAQTRNFGDLVPARKMEVANGQVFDPFNVKPGTRFDDINPNQPFSLVNGQLVPNQPFQTFAINKAKAGAAKTSVDARTIHTQEEEQSKVYGKSLGELRSNISTAAFNAPQTLAKFNRIEELLQGVDGGGLAPAGLQIATAANSIGLKLDPKLGNKEAAEALTRELASGLRQPGTGPQTDKDFENFMTQVPSLSKTAEGRKQIIATARAKLARDIEIGKLARDYAKKNNGVIDDGFLDIVSDYVAQNPVVPRVSTSNRPNQFPDASAIEQELAKRNRGGR